jgi:ATP-dependent metalloprotease
MLLVSVCGQLHWVSTYQLLVPVRQVGREDEFSINRQQMLARIWVCMGGQVAEEVIFGRDQITSGATDDLRQVCTMGPSGRGERSMLCTCAPAVLLFSLWL